MAYSAPSMALWLLLSLAFILFPTISRCSDVAAWWTNKGPSIAYQDGVGGALVYSLCNTSEVVMTRGTAFTFQTDDDARTGTSLAVTGWLDSNNTLWVSLVESLPDIPAP